MISRLGLTKKEVKEILNPYSELIYNEIQNGFQDYIDNDLVNAHIHNNCTKSNLISSYIIYRIRKLVFEKPELKLIEQQRMIILLVKDKVAIRFKKLDKDYKSLNIPTKQSRKFRNRSLNFKGTSAIPVDAGWRLNEFYTEIEDISFVCPDGKNNLWRIPLEDISVIKTQPAIFPIPKEDVIEVVTVKPNFVNANRKTAN